MHHTELGTVEFSETGFDSLEIADAPRILRASKAGKNSESRGGCTYMLPNSCSDAHT